MSEQLLLTCWSAHERWYLQLPMQQVKERWRCEVWTAAGSTRNAAVPLSLACVTSLLSVCWDASQCWCQTTRNREREWDHDDNCFYKITPPPQVWPEPSSAWWKGAGYINSIHIVGTGSKRLFCVWGTEQSWQPTDVFFLSTGSSFHPPPPPTAGKGYVFLPTVGNDFFFIHLLQSWSLHLLLAESRTVIQWNVSVTALISFVLCSLASVWKLLLFLIRHHLIFPSLMPFKKWVFTMI